MTSASVPMEAERVSPLHLARIWLRHLISGQNGHDINAIRAWQI